MQTHTILIILGAVLLLAGVMGGGLTLKEMKLPSLDKSSRVLAGIVGAAFIAAGIYLERGERVPQAVAPEPRQAQAPRQDSQAEAKAAQEQATATQEQQAEADRARQREDEGRDAAAARQKEQQQADFTRRALVAPKGNAWQGEFRMYDPADNRELATGVLQFGPTSYAENIAYARLQVEKSALRQVPRGRLEADKAVWGWMGAATDSAISIVFGKAADNPVLVFNKVIKDRENGYLELRGVLSVNQGGKSTVVAHVRASCRAR